MPDFSSLLKKEAGKAKKPATLPAGDYPGIIKSHEYGDQNRNKTPYVRFNVGLTDWPASLGDSWEEADISTGEVRTVARSEVDLSKRSMRRDFYLTDDAMFRLDAFLRDLGVDMAGHDYESIIPTLTGTPVLVTVEQYVNQQSNEMGAQVKQLSKLA